MHTSSKNTYIRPIDWPGQTKPQALGEKARATNDTAMQNVLSQLNDLKGQLTVARAICDDPLLNEKITRLNKEVETLESASRTAAAVERYVSKELLSLIDASELYQIRQFFLTYEKNQRVYLKILTSLEEIADSLTSETMGSIRKNLRLSKIRKQFVTIEAKRIPTETALFKLEQFICTDLSDQNLNACLKETHQKNSELQSLLLKISEKNKRIEICRTQIQRFLGLMDFLSSHGSGPFEDENNSLKQFAKHSEKLARQCL